MSRRAVESVPRTEYLRGRATPATIARLNDLRQGDETVSDVLRRLIDAEWERTNG